MGPGLKVETIKHNSGPVVKFPTLFATYAALYYRVSKQSLNVSSVVLVANGRTTLNFGVAYPTRNYSVSTSVCQSLSGAHARTAAVRTENNTLESSTKLVSAVQIVNYDGWNLDETYVSIVD